jgi:hypothetical protein
VRTIREDFNETYSPSKYGKNNYSETYSNSSNGKGFTLEKTKLTVHGIDEPVNDRERAFLKDKLARQIEESQCLVDELLDSNRRHAEKLHNTLNHLMADFNTPSKKGGYRVADRSTADSIGNRLY